MTARLYVTSIRCASPSVSVSIVSYPEGNIFRVYFQFVLVNNVTALFGVCVCVCVLGGVLGMRRRPLRPNPAECFDHVFVWTSHVVLMEAIVWLGLCACVLACLRLRIECHIQ